MPMPDDFCILILTHGRPDSQYTVDSLKRHGYTGKWYIVIDDEDSTAERYRELYGDKVLQFSKSAIATTFDEADNFNDRRAIVYARNASFDLARKVGCRYFMQFDDDYISFEYRFDEERRYRYSAIHNLDKVICLLLEYFIACPQITSLCMSQGGDHIGGGSSTYTRTLTMRRKGMNSFLCDIERPFLFQGRINEDVNTYTDGGRRGLLFLTNMQVKLTQKITQTTGGGMSDIYLSVGTYIKSFYTVIFCPSSVKIDVIGSNEKDKHVHYRIHHKVYWRYTCPAIIRERHRK